MVKVSRLNHSSFLIEGTKNIFIDPYNIKTSVKADYIFITHPHFDHCSIEDIKRVRKKDTVVVMPNMGNAKRIAKNCVKLRPWQEFSSDDIAVRAVPSYNIEKQYHPKANGWLGFVITLDGENIYHAGDTDLIEEMKFLKEITYALLPVSGNYTMDADSAASAAEIIKPKVAIPMHYGGIVGGIKDAKRFKELCSCAVDIL